MLKHFEICGQRFELYSPDKGRIEQSVIDRCLWAKAKDVAKRRDSRSRLRFKFGYCPVSGASHFLKTG